MDPQKRPRISWKPLYGRARHGPVGKQLWSLACRPLVAAILATFGDPGSCLCKALPGDPVVPSPGGSGIRSQKPLQVQYLGPHTSVIPSP